MEKIVIVKFKYFIYLYENDLGIFYLRLIYEENDENDEE